MKERGETACILQLKVLSTKSSILCIVLASNTNLDSTTYGERAFTPIRRSKKESSETQRMKGNAGIVP